MKETIRSYPPGTPERIALETLALVLSAISPNRTRYLVEDVYFDFGQDWIWSTICAHKPSGESWQILNPRDYAEIISGKDTLEAAADLRRGPHWLDK